MMVVLQHRAAGFVRAAQVGLCVCVAVLAGCSAVADDDVEVESQHPPVTDLPSGETQVEGFSSETVFRDAADEFGVPASLLKAIAWVETGAEMVEGHEEFPGRPAAYGIMALRGEWLQRGAAYAGVSPEVAMHDLEANVRAAAAVLSQLADELTIERTDLGAWAEVAVIVADIPDLQGRAQWVHDDLFRVLQDGVVTEQLSIDAHDVQPKFAVPDASSASGPDYADAIWRPSPNYSSRSSGAHGDVQMLIIHSCEGSYAGCWSWLKNSASGVSAHYVVNGTGSEVTQLVKESKKAWHIGATYDCWLNDGTACSLSGYGSNNFTVGIEHAGYASQSSWSSGLIHASAKLSCDITAAHGIPRDKYHIVSHGQLQPYNRIDPGPNWPWAEYLELVGNYCGDAAPPTPEDPPEEPPEQEDPSGDFSVIVDSNNNSNDANASCEVSSTWTGSSNVSGYYNTGYWWRSTGPSSDLALFKAKLDSGRKIEVQAWWSAAQDRSPDAPFIIFDGDGSHLDTVYVNQQQSGGQWVSLGSYDMKAGWIAAGLSRWTGAGYVVVADAVRFIEVP